MLYFYVILLMVLNLSGGVIIKSFSNSPVNPCLFIFLFACLGTIFSLQILTWILLGKRYQLSYVYPLLSLNYILSLVVSYVFFAETITISRIVGAVIIMVGTIFTSLSPNSVDADVIRQTPSNIEKDSEDE